MYPIVIVVDFQNLSNVYDIVYTRWLDAIVCSIVVNNGD